MQKAIILTEKEYEDLLKVQSKPDDLLRETNLVLKKKLDEAESKIKKGSFDNIKVNSPFIIVNGKLCLHSATDFIIMYNNLADSSLMQSDVIMLNQLIAAANLFNLDCQFANTKELKAYRVSLQKKQLCTPIKINGRNYLQIKKDNKWN